VTENDATTPTANDQAAGEQATDSSIEAQETVAAAESAVEEPVVAEAVVDAPAVEAPAVVADVVSEAVVEEAVVEAPAVVADVVPEASVEAPAVVTDVVPEASVEAPAVEPGVVAETAPSPAPSPRAVPRPMPRPPTAPQQPSAVSPGSPLAAAAEPTVLTPAPSDSAEFALAAAFGRVDEDGTVYVREAAGERVVGQYAGAAADAALAMYVRRFLDLQAKVVVFEARLRATDLAVKEIDQTLTKLTDELAEPAAVGDLDGVRARLEALRPIAKERRAAAEAERAAAKEAALRARTEIVEAAERIAATDPERIQWRPAGEQLRVLLEQWKEAQRNGPRPDRSAEESLWKRFSHARTTFDRERRHFFAELEQRNAQAKSSKEVLVERAEALSTSTDWATTASAYRDLMAEWKSAGRASRQDDDALWARFRAAQDAFFAARDGAATVTDNEFRANLDAKEALLVEAEKLVPVKDIAAAKQSLRSIQERWDAAGKVPRADISRIEARLRTVETTIRDADQSAWSRSNPETRARAEGAAAQLQAAIAGLEAELAAAKASGNASKTAEAQAALDARRAWLEQVQRAAKDS
jgi:hypothetical protein